jgi:hypothetical protein
MDPYYEDADVLIYNADLRELPDVGAVACAVTSPPYNSGVAYDVHRDSLTVRTTGNWRGRPLTSWPRPWDCSREGPGPTSG